MNFRVNLDADSQGTIKLSELTHSHAWMKETFDALQTSLDGGVTRTRVWIFSSIDDPTIIFTIHDQQHKSVQRFSIGGKQEHSQHVEAFVVWIKNALRARKNWPGQ